MKLYSKGGKEPGVYPCISRDNPEYEKIESQTVDELDKLIKEKGEDYFLQYSINHLNWLKNIKMGDLKRKNKSCYSDPKIYSITFYDAKTGRELVLRERIVFLYIIDYYYKKLDLNFAKALLDFIENTDSTVLSSFLGVPRQSLFFKYYKIITNDLSDQPIKRVETLSDELIKYIKTDKNRSIGIRMLIMNITEDIEYEMKKEVFNIICEKYKKCIDCDENSKELVLSLLADIAGNIKDDEHFKKLEILLNEANLHYKIKERIIDRALNGER